MAAIKQADGGDRSSPAPKKKWGKHQAGSQMLPAHQSKLSQKFALDKLLMRCLPAPGNKNPTITAVSLGLGSSQKWHPLIEVLNLFLLYITFLDRDVLASFPLPVPFLVLPICRNAAQLPCHPKHSSAVIPHLEYSQPGDVRHLLNFVSLWEWVAMMVNVYFQRTRPPVPNSSFIIHTAVCSSPARPYLLLLLGTFYVDLRCWR